MSRKSERRETRRREIGDRITGIRSRINDLKRADREDRHPATSAEQLAEAQHHAADSEASARQALAASVETFLSAARAHERCASLHERAAAAGGSDEEQHRQQAASHRAAAAADRQRAVTAQSFLSPRGDDPEDEQPR